MRKLENRAKICLLIAAVLFGGLVIFTWRYVVNGGDWAGFYGNTQIYTNGQINRGRIFDRNGSMLLNCTEDGIKYNDDSSVRAATVYAVGDPKGNIATGAINMYKSRLIGYDILNGIYDTTSSGKEIRLTIDADASKAAYEALGGREGFVGVFNYKTGEIVTLVNTPGFDPAGELPSNPESSIYFNTFMMGRLTPGSTFKLVTSSAAISHMDTDSFSFTCNGVNEFYGSKIKCTGVHGTVGFEDALAKSCNGAFGEISRTVGAKNLKKATEDAGLTKSIDIGGIRTAKGKFEFPANDDISLSWAGIGQYKDQVNPCSMMVFMGSIANGGEAIRPRMIQSSNFISKLTGGDSLGTYLEEDVADKLKSMMKNNVETNYGTSRFPGLDIYAKSGTAEVGAERSDAWFVGFLGDSSHPYAFVSWVKGGGTGYIAAGDIANKTLQALVKKN